MLSPTHLHFDLSIGRQKPENIRNRETKCPFCDRNSLDDIISKRESIWLVKNKYPVLQDAFQTVLIETDDCDSEMSLYSKEHLYQVLHFGVNHWLDMERSGQYASVLFFKNHGPLSGGTIRHPHMQIIGLENIDYRTEAKLEHFEGIKIHNHNGVILNVSTKPRIGFFEFNIIGRNLDFLNEIADIIQKMVHYTLNHFHKSCNSYNLFFYHLEGQIFVKIVPRFVTSPLFVGFSIPQVPTYLGTIVSAIQDKYF